MKDAVGPLFLNIAEFHADESVINDILTCLRRGGTLREYPARLRHRDGSIRHVCINSSVLFEDGKFVHSVALPVMSPRCARNKKRIC